MGKKHLKSMGPFVTLLKIIIKNPSKLQWSDTAFHSSVHQINTSLLEHTTIAVIQFWTQSLRKLDWILAVTYLPRVDDWNFHVCCRWYGILQTPKGNRSHYSDKQQLFFTPRSATLKECSHLCSIAFERRPPGSSHSQHPTKIGPIYV